jgi:crotonobetainyl-CoA:carnitine CoA-transferase CaiB-like acyl-CoA transferase
LAINGVIGALAALAHRDRTGEGQMVDVSMIESSVHCLAEPIVDVQLNGRLPGPQGNLHRALYPHGVYPCRDGQQWAALVVRNAKEWASLCVLIGMSDWASDASLVTTDARRARRAEIDAAITEWCSSCERDEAVRRLHAAGVVAAPVLDIAERDEHAHFRARGLTLEHPGPDGSAPYRIYATPWLLSATPPALRRAAPALGQDNDDVLGGLLGLDAHEIEALAAQGVLA